MELNFHKNTILYLNSFNFKKRYGAIKHPSDHCSSICSRFNIIRPCTQGKEIKEGSIQRRKQNHRS